jgi:hypothetical protein
VCTGNWASSLKPPILCWNVEAESSAPRPWMQRYAPPPVGVRQPCWPFDADQLTPGRSHTAPPDDLLARTEQPKSTLCASARRGVCPKRWCTTGFLHL